MPRPTDVCPVCSGSAVAHGRALVLGKYEADYRRCSSCGVVFIADPTWLEEAYAQPIKDEDSGLLLRCARMAARASLILRGEGIRRGRFLDWGGGYGTFTRMMRDRGYEFFHDDAYCDNLFAQGLEDEPGTRYDLISAFEVFEHLGDPVNELAEVAARTDRLLFSTMLVGDPAPAVDAWWYYGVEHAQHITLHTERSLRALGEHLGFQLTTNGVNLHMFHRHALRAPTRMIFSQAGRKARARVWNAVVPAKTDAR